MRKNTKAENARKLLDALKKESETDYFENDNSHYCQVTNEELVSKNKEIPLVKIKDILNSSLYKKYEKYSQLKAKVERLGIDINRELSLWDILETFGFLSFCIAFSLSTDAQLIDCSIPGWRLKLVLINKALKLHTEEKRNDQKFLPTSDDVENYVRVFRNNYDNLLRQSPPFLKQMLELIFGKSSIKSVDWNSSTFKPMDLFGCVQFWIDVAITKKHKGEIQTAFGENLSKNVSKFNYLAMEIAAEILKAYFNTEWTNSFQQRSPTFSGKILVSLEDMDWIEMIKQMNYQFVDDYTNDENYTKILHDLEKQKPKKWSYEDD